MTKIEGGCEHCDAVQLIEPDPDHPSAVMVWVVHGELCPWVAERQQRADS